MILRLHSREHLVGNIWLFRFAPERPLAWIAGQFIRVELPHAEPDEEGTIRRFTIASAPHEPTVNIATRLTATSFKQALAALPIGGGLTVLDTPAGDFVWQDTPAPVVFVAHGIGITPFYSILKDRRHRGQPLTAQLLYSNHPGAGVAFQAELEAWAQQHPEFGLHHSSAPFTPTQLAELVPQLNQTTVYVSGPRSLIALLGPPYGLASRQLKQDFFPGYPASSY